MAKRLPLDVKALQFARKLIARPNGWIKGKIKDEQGGYCAWGAILAASTETKQYAPWSLRGLVEECIPKRGERFGDLVRYNDNANRRRHHVVALFDRAIAKARKEYGATK